MLNTVVDTDQGDTNTNIIEEGKDVSYKAQLTAPLSSLTGIVTIRTFIESGAEYCTLAAPLVDIQRGYTNYNATFDVDIVTTEAVGDAQQKCVIKHTITSKDLGTNIDYDPCYNTPFEKEFEIQIMRLVLLFKFFLRYMFFNQIQLNSFCICSF